MSNSGVHGIQARPAAAPAWGKEHFPLATALTTCHHAASRFQAAARRDKDREFCMALLEHAYVNPAQALGLVSDMPLVDSEKRRLRATIRRWAKTLRDAGHAIPHASAVKFPK